MEGHSLGCTELECTFDHFYTDGRSYQLEADVPTGGIDKGAFIHFSEQTMGANLTTATPWIAYVSCDQNETGASQEWDIFTLARDRGAVAAVSSFPTMLISAHVLLYCGIVLAQCRVHLRL
jgi:hypothetical protein